MKPRTAITLVVTAAALWGTTGTAQALGPDGIDPLAVGTFRLAVAAPALWVIASFLGEAPRPPLPRPSLLIAGAAMASYQPWFFSAVARTGVAVGTLVAIGSAPILTAGGVWLLERRRPGLGWWTGTGIAGLGLMLLLRPSSGVDAAGVGLAVMAGISYAAYALAAKRLLPAASPVRAMAAVFTVAAIGGIGWLPFTNTSWAASTAGTAVILHLGLVATAVAYALFSAGLRIIRVDTAATLSLAEPLVATLLGVVILGETLTGGTLLGAAALAVGLIVVSADEIGERRQGADVAH